MLDEKEIEIEIARLEYMESSYPNYAKLADLYTIRNQMNGNGHGNISESDYMRGSSQKSGADVIGDYGDSEFLIAISGCEAIAVWSIIDDLMDTLRVVNPRAYNSVLRKIGDL